MKIAYKVVKLEGDLLVSSNAIGECKVSYNVRKWATAPIGGLLVFKNEIFARRFSPKGTIFKCHVLEPVRLPSNRASNPSWLTEVLTYWKLPPRRFRGAWPAGTLAFRMVKLLDQVQ